MEDRLTQCLNEIMFSNDCPSELRGILDSVLQLNEKINYMDANDFDHYFFDSPEYIDDIFELFGVDINK